MEFNIDEYKISNNMVYLNGWVHLEKYKIKLISNGEIKYIDKFNSRYDICMLFHEKIEDNNYGFKEEIKFSKKIKKIEIYLVNKDEETLIFKIDNRKTINFLRKIRKILGKIKRGIKFLWREYHFMVPPSMMKKYMNQILKKGNKETLYNPNIDSEYNTWLELQKYRDDEEKLDITFMGNSKNNIKDFVLINDYEKQLKKIKTKYICLINGKIDVVDSFFAEVKEFIDDNYDLIYFDNDRISEKSKLSNPIFKPEWSRDTLLGVNYIGNCFIIKTSLLKKINIDKFDVYYILLKLINKKIKIKHIPRILYHDKNEIINEIKTLKRYLKEEKINAEIISNPDKVTNIVKYIPSGKSLVSIIIPTKDHADILDQCLKSVYEKTTYKNYEIIVIDNNSEEKETFDLLRKYDKKYKNFKYKRIECEFNYSYLNNEAAKIAKGEYILLLNNDIEVISPDWLENMLGYAEQNHVGTVGAKLLFPDNTIQHAGIIMGKGGLAGHAHYEKKNSYISPQYELKIPYDYSACTAACLMVSKKKFNEVNGLEEKLKVAFNDVDFNLKLLDKGYNNVFLPNVKLYHYESKSRGLDTTPEKQKRFVQEWSYMKDKWNKYMEHDPFYNDNFSKNDDYMLK